MDDFLEAGIFLDFHLAVPKLHIGRAELLFGSHLLGDVCECHNP
jgi:hypothetical protein